MNIKNTSFDKLDSLPPAHQLLIREFENGISGDLFKRLKKLWPELQRQAEWTSENFDYVDRSSGPDSSKCSASLLAGLDPFTIEGKCSSLPCRVQTAMHIGRSIGIYADRVLVWDLLSSEIRQAEELNEYVVTTLATEAAVLVAMRPLLEAGIFEFESPLYSVCNECRAVWDDRIESLATTVLDDIRPGLDVEVDGDTITFSSPEIADGLVYQQELSLDDQRAIGAGIPLDVIAKNMIEGTIAGQISTTFHRLRDSSNLGAIAFSNSRVGLLAARELDGYRPNFQELQAWEASRSAKLPWIGDLSMEQVVQVREEADSALPRFRERLRTLMVSRDTGANIDAVNVASELRENALEIENEMRALNFRGRNRHRNLQGLIGLTIAVYGFAGEFIEPAAALGGLSVLLHKLHESHSGDARKRELLSSQPGYVLVKAKELAKHADTGS